MFLGFINRNKNNSNQTNEIELSSRQTNSSNNNNNSNNEHIYEEILDYYDKDIQIVNENASLSTRKKCVRFKSNQTNAIHSSDHFTDISSTLPSSSTSTQTILMPILRIDPMLKNATNTMFSSSVSSTSSASSSSSSSSSSSCIYTSSSLTSSNSSNHSIVFNQMVEDFLNHCTLKLNKPNNEIITCNNNSSISLTNKLKLKKKKKAVLNTSINSSTSTMSSNSSTNNTLNSSHNLGDFKCCCQQQTGNTLSSNPLDKLSYRVTNLTLDDLKKRQKLIYEHQKSLNNCNLFNTVRQF